MLKNGCSMSTDHPLKSTYIIHTMGDICHTYYGRHMSYILWETYVTHTMGYICHTYYGIHMSYIPWDIYVIHTMVVICLLCNTVARIIYIS